jgi:hypothetical protein
MPVLPKVGKERKSLKNGYMQEAKELKEERETLDAFQLLLGMHGEVAEEVSNVPNWSSKRRDQAELKLSKLRNSQHLGSGSYADALYRQARLGVADVEFDDHMKILRNQVAIQAKLVTEMQTEVERKKKELHGFVARLF